MKPIIVIETIQAKPGKYQELKQALLDITPLSLSEKGCLSYEIAEPMQEKNQLLVIMRWDSIEAMQAHHASLHVLEFIKKYDNVVYGDVEETAWLTY